MRHNTIFAAVGAVVLAVSVLCDHMVPRLPMSHPHILPIQRMPGRMGDWHSVSDRDIDPDVKARLTSAKLLERIYADRTGRQVDLLLVTASDSDDIHDPKSCFPTQGWDLQYGKAVQVGPSRIDSMVATQGGVVFDVLYWQTGNFALPPSSNPLVRQLTAMRSRMVGPDEGMSLFVRLMVDHTSESKQVLQSFAAQIMPAIQDIVVAGRDARR